MTRSDILEQRLLNFSVLTVKYLESLKLNQAIINQCLRSATSVGANYTEANNASSKADFRNKVFIAKKEASETRYWFRIIGELCGKSKDHEFLLQEVSEFILIFQKIVTTIKNGSDK